MLNSTLIFGLDLVGFVVKPICSDNWELVVYDLSLPDRNGHKKDMALHIFSSAEEVAEYLVNMKDYKLSVAAFRCLNLDKAEYSALSTEEKIDAITDSLSNLKPRSVGCY